MDDNKQQASIEELMSESQSILEKLSEPQIKLEDAFNYYEQGMRLIKECGQKIDAIEKKMLIVNEEGNLEEA